MADRLIAGKAVVAGSGDVVEHTEERMARMMVFIRVGSVAFVFIPIFSWSKLPHPWIAVVAAVAAAAEAGWFWHRARRHDLRDRLLVRVDVGFCIALMLIGSRAARPRERNVLTTELLPFSLGSPACLGFSCELSIAAVSALLGLMAAWSLSVYPNITLKLASDLFGFAFWYVITLLTARVLRALSHQTAAAQQAAAESQRLVAEREKEAAVALQREHTHREIHDRLLPVVDHVASGQRAPDWIVEMARGAATHARRLIIDPRTADGRGFAARVAEACEQFSMAGLALVPVVTIEQDPSDEVAEAVLAATYEALRNVWKHAQTLHEVTVFVESTAAGVEIVVRDHGVGFDPATVRPGGGLAGTYGAVRRQGGAVDIRATPGSGTSVTIRWPATAAESS